MRPHFHLACVPIDSFELGSSRIPGARDAFLDFTLVLS